MSVPSHSAALLVSAGRPACSTQSPDVRHQKSGCGAGGAGAALVLSASGFRQHHGLVTLMVSGFFLGGGRFQPQNAAPDPKAASSPLTLTSVPPPGGKTGGDGRGWVSSPGFAHGETEAGEGGRCWRDRVAAGQSWWLNLWPPQRRAVPPFPSHSRPASACPGVDLMGCNENKNEAGLMGFLLF